MLLKGIFIIPDGSPIPFQYNPEEINQERSVNYVKKEPLGMSHPVYHYRNGGGDELSFTMRVRDTLSIGGMKIPFSVDLYAGLLLDLTYPIRKQGIMISSPPEILFIFGTLIKKCKIAKVSVVKKEFSDLLIPVYGDISITLFQVTNKNINRKNSVKNLPGGF